jgi:hypothetical protein
MDSGAFKTILKHFGLKSGRKCKFLDIKMMIINQLQKLLDANVSLEVPLLINSPEIIRAIFFRGKTIS